MVVLVVGPSAALDSVGPSEDSADGEDLGNSDMDSESGKDDEEQGPSSERRHSRRRGHRCSFFCF